MAVTGTGFIIDAVSAYVENTDGNYHLVTATSGEVKLGGENLEINAGESAYPLARFNTKRTVDISLTDARLDTSAFVMATGGTKTTGNVNDFLFGTGYTVEAVGHTITLPYVAVASSVKIAGMTETQSGSPGATEFKVTPNTPTGKTTVLFNTAKDGATVYPKYEVQRSNGMSVTVNTNDFPASAFCVIRFPIYDDTTIDSTITSYGVLQVYKAQIKADYGMGGSYKTNSTFKMDLYGLDPRRQDGAMFKFDIVPIS